MGDFVGLFKSTIQPNWSQDNLAAFLRDQLPLTTWMLLGAVAQSVLTLAVGRIGLIPAAAFLLYRVADAYAIKTGLKHNHYKDGVIDTKFSAQLPNADGTYGNQPAKDDLCVFLIGTKVNSPLGILEPGFKDIDNRFKSMVKELRDESDKYGFLGSTSWLAMSESANNAIMTVMYFRNAACVHQYAESPLHREGWAWYNRALGQKGNISIFHELYQVPSGNWEAIYANMQPFNLPATQYRMTNKEGGEPKWMSAIVDARKGLLKTSKGRMSRSDAKEHDDHDLANPYQADFAKV